MGKKLKAVRWLGAYGHVSKASYAFEANPGRPVSAEAFLGNKPRLRRLVGLLIKIEETELLAGFGHDAWTPRGGSHYRMRKSMRHGSARPQRVNRWDLVVELAATTTTRQYVEVVVNRPVYCAVVYDRRGGDHAAKQASEWGEALGLPVRPI